MKTPLEIAIQALSECRSRSVPCGYDSGDSRIVEIVEQALSEIEDAQTYIKQQNYKIAASLKLQ